MPTPQFLPGQTLPASVLQQLGDEATFTPVLRGTTTDPDLGTAPIQKGWIWLNGNMVHVWFEIVFGTGATNGSGTYELELPTAYPARADWVNLAQGVIRMLDVGSSVERIGVVVAESSNERVQFRNTVDAVAVSATTPWTWAATDILNGYFTYLTDFGA